MTLGLVRRMLRFQQKRRDLKNALTTPEANCCNGSNTYQNQPIKSSQVIVAKLDTPTVMAHRSLQKNERIISLLRRYANIK